MIMKMRVCEVVRWKDDTIHPSTVPRLIGQEKNLIDVMARVWIQPDPTLPKNIGA